MLFRTSPPLAHAVDLMHSSTSPAVSFDELTWFSSFYAWLLRLDEYPPLVKRLRHSLMLFGLDQLHDRIQQPFCPHAIPCIALYLNTLTSLTEDELRTPIWEDDHGELKQAYLHHLSQDEEQEQMHSHAISTLNVQSPEPEINKDLVFDLLRTVLTTLNLGTSLGTPYSHISPLLLQTLKHPGFSLSPILMHLYALRICQFELLNAQTLDLPGEVRTLHGQLAAYVLAAIHETSWVPKEPIAILDTLVWNTLCLNDGMCMHAPFEWLDSCVHKLPNSGLLSLHGLSLHSSEKSPHTPLVYTPAFSSLRSYAMIAQQDHGKRYRRTDWFERHYPQLGQAMHILLGMVPHGALAASDWSTLASHWRTEVQGLPESPDGHCKLPEDFTLEQV